APLFVRFSACPRMVANLGRFFKAPSCAVQLTVGPRSRDHEHTASVQWFIGVTVPRMNTTAKDCSTSSCMGKAPSGRMGRERLRTGMPWDHSPEVVWTTKMVHRSFR
ncbi:unnamed protein product, partial [Ectocarpus sp. 12 AP-2014]